MTIADDGLDIGNILQSRNAVDTAGEGMLRLLPWATGLTADKLGPQQITFMPSCGQHAHIDLQKPLNAKRKRTSSPAVDLRRGGPEPVNGKMAKKPDSLPKYITPNSISSPTQKPATLVSSPAQRKAIEGTGATFSQPKIAPAQVSSLPTKMESTTPKTNLVNDKLSKALDLQMNQEILLKHNELRLIDQEIAKCQIALEQLRRCKEIPYPSTQLSESVSRGRGSAVRSSRSAVQPQSPAPWGVTDGPYTRHYAKWLIPDPLFDGGETPIRAVPKTPSGKTPAKGRSTRGSLPDSSLTGQTKVQRNGSFQALSSGYPQPREKVGPMIQKRKSDGILVKLVCLDCRRENFSSAQGFINHCRIAHSRNFASHDAAADACGEPVDVDEAGAVIGNDAPPSSSLAGLVHPLIYSAHTLKSKSATKTGPHPSVSHKSKALKPSAATPIAFVSPSVNLVPSPLTPNLSSLLQKRGCDLDLKGLITDMKTPVPIEEAPETESEGEDEDISMLDAPALGRHPHATGNIPALRSPVTTQHFQRNTGTKHMKQEKQDRKPTSLVLNPGLMVPGTFTPTAYTPSIAGDDMEPSPTNESNQAPSLVEDDGDDDYDAPSPAYTESESMDSDNRDVDIKVEDGEDDVGPSTRNRCNDSDYNTPKQPVSPATRRRTSAFRRSIVGREEKHVSFVSPSPARELGITKTGGDRKRKRTSSVSQ